MATSSGTSNSSSGSSSGSNGAESTYPYYKYIKSPQELGMSTRGTMGALTRDVDGLVNYVKLLVTGSSSASATGQPLGNKFFMSAGGATCQYCPTDASACETQPRYVYINNVPDGDIPFISTAMGGEHLTDFRGLIPGAMGNLASIDPGGIFRSFTMGANPPCIQIGRAHV